MYQPERQRWLNTQPSLTPGQINYMLRTPQPGIQLASERDAKELGFRWQTVPRLFGGWQSCQAKYCLAVP